MLHGAFAFTVSVRVLAAVSRKTFASNAATVGAVSASVAALDSVIVPSLFTTQLPDGELVVTVTEQVRVSELPLAGVVQLCAAARSGAAANDNAIATHHHFIAAEPP